jgi:hypothetical protein
MLTDDKAEDPEGAACTFLERLQDLRDSRKANEQDG